MTTPSDGPVPQGTWSIEKGPIAEIARRETREAPGVVEVTDVDLWDPASGGLSKLRSRFASKLKTGQTGLKISLIAEYGRILPDLVEEVRERAARAVEGMTGYHVAAVDITVADLHVPGEPLPTREPGSDGEGSGARVDF